MYDRLIPDSERHYAGLVADHLQIPIRYDVRDDETSIADWDQVSVHTPEPVDNPPAFAAGIEFFGDRWPRRRASSCYGEGPDNALLLRVASLSCRISLASRRVAPLCRALANDSADASARALVVVDSPHCRAAGRRETMAGSVSGLAQRRIRGDAAGAESDGKRSSAPQRRRIRSDLADINGFSAVRWQSLFEVCDINGALSHSEIAASISRPAAAAIHAGPAGDAVVPEQTDHPQVDANGVAGRGAPAKENQLCR